MKFGNFKYNSTHERRQGDLFQVSTKYDDIPLVHFRNCRFGERKFKALASLPKPDLVFYGRSVSPTEVHVGWPEYSNFILQNRGLVGFLLHRMPQPNPFVPTGEEASIGNCLVDINTLKTNAVDFVDGTVENGKDYTYRICSVERTQ